MTMKILLSLLSLFSCYIAWRALRDLTENEFPYNMPAFRVTRNEVRAYLAAATAVAVVLAIAAWRW